MNKKQSSAATMLKSVVNGRYNGCENTREKIVSNVINRQNDNKISGTITCFENLTELALKKEGYEMLRQAIDNLESLPYDSYERSESYHLLRAVGKIDNSNQLKQAISSFSAKTNVNVSIPHCVRILFSVDKVTPEDLTMNLLAIKSVCNLDDKFIADVVCSDYRYKNCLDGLQQAILQPQPYPYPPQPYPPQPYPPGQFQPPQPYPYQIQGQPQPCPYPAQPLPVIPPANVDPNKPSPINYDKKLFAGKQKNQIQAFPNEMSPKINTPPPYDPNPYQQIPFGQVPQQPPYPGYGGYPPNQPPPPAPYY